MRSCTTFLLGVALTGCTEPEEQEQVVPDTCPVFDVDDAPIALTAVGEGTSVLVPVTNDCASGEDLVVTATIEGAAFAVTNPSLSIPAGGSADLVVTWAGEADDVGTLTIATNDDARPYARITLDVDFTPGAVDLDEDGFFSEATGGEDCDDADAEVFPGATEWDDGVDQDCDGLVDEDYVYPLDVWVTEVGVGGSGWVELANYSDRTIVLAGFTLGAAAGEATLTTEVLAPATRIVVTPGFAIGASDTVSLKSNVQTIASVTWSGASDTWAMDESVGDPLKPDAWCSMKATPGDENGWCTSVDHDGDYVSVDEGDCDDTNIDVRPGAADVWNGIDDDCDGSADVATADGIAAGWLEGSGAEYLGQLGSGDVDGDGKVEVLVGTPQGGKVYLLEGANHASWGGSIAGYADAVVTGTSYWFGETSPRLADNLGGGGDDLVLASSEQVTIFEGPLSGDLSEGDADVVISGYDSNYYVQVRTDVDLDGDGVAEVMTAAEDARYVLKNDGYVTIHDVSGGNGAYTFVGADARFTTPEDDIGLGASIGGGDLDGDGYGDAVFGAYDDDEGGSYAGAIFLVRGGETLPAGGAVESAYDIKILGDASSYESLGRVAPVIEDVDGDGANDLVVSSGMRLYTFLDGSTLADGAYTYTDADAALTGTLYAKQFGGSFVAADLDGDGQKDEIATYARDAVASQRSVNLYTNDWLLASSWDDFGGRISEEMADSGMGDNVIAADLDGDGDDDLVVSAPMQVGMVDGYPTRTGKIFSFDL